MRRSGGGDQLREGRPLWFIALLTGGGTAFVAAAVAVVAVAVLWLPAAGGAGSAGSAVRAGLITFVAALHGGVTVDGLDAAFLPLGLLFLVAMMCRRAGRALADTSATLATTDSRDLARAGGVQIAAFAVASGVLAVLAHLGTSGVSILGAIIAATIVFTLSGGVAFARATTLGATLRDGLPGWVAPALRVAGSVLVVYLIGGAVLAGVSLVVHHARVETLSAQVGGGWAGVPLLLLGSLAAPNAAIAGASYLAGPGFTVGSGTTVALRSSPHGRLPAFPVLGALPSGPAPWGVWLLAVAIPLAAGLCAAVVAARSTRRWRTLAAGVAASAFGGLVLAWQGGGSIGSGRLHTVGASPWQFGCTVAVASGLAGSAWLAAWIGLVALRARASTTVEPDGRLGAIVASIGATVEAAAAEIEQVTAEPKRDGPDSLAG